MATKAILITGSTGKQGGSVVDALLRTEMASYEILALTRDAQSPASKKLIQKSSNIKLVTGNLDSAESVFEKAKEATQTPIWGVFSVQPVGKNEEAQGKALIDAAIKHGVQHFIYSSADRGGASSSTSPTNVPHFITKHDIEQHLFTHAKTSNITYTILRPVAFYDNLTPDFFGKVFTTSWAVKMPKDCKLQLIATSDIAFFVAQAFLGADEPMYKNQSLSLAGDALTFDEFMKFFEKETEEKLPLTYGLVAQMLCTLSKELGYMFDWFREVGFGASMEECKELNPGMKGFATWLQTESAWKKQ